MAEEVTAIYLYK